jgi:hypothetical protein
MITKILSNLKFLYVVLIVQFIPLLLNPPSIFEFKSQEWWLPLLLVLMALMAVIQVFRNKVTPWTLSLLSFSHGFNIISRLMMLLPKSTAGSSFDSLYFVLSIVSMLFSAFMLWLLEIPHTRQVLTR